MIQEKRKNLHENIYLIAIILMFISMPLSRFGMSVSQFVLVGNWLLEGNIKKKWQRFIYNKAAVILASFWLIHVIGLLYTSDFHYAMEDLRKKLPLLLLPILFSSIQPFTFSKVKLIFKLYVAAVFAGVVIGFYKLFFVEIKDIREISPFISHIRFSLHIVMVSFISLYFVIYEKKILARILFAIAILVFLIFLVALESITGLFIMSFILVGIGFYFLIVSEGRIKVVIGILILLFIVGLSQYVTNAYDEYFIAKDTKDLAIKTVKGNDYYSMDSEAVENGYHIYWYICEMELEESWNKRSKYKFTAKDLKEQSIKYTLIRFLNSKGLKKDAQGVDQLTLDEIKAIEKGEANVVYTQHFNPKARLFKLFWEYSVFKNERNPSGHSLVQRLFFWKHGFNIVKQNFIIGVGTGDVPHAYEMEYIKNESKLDKNHRFRAHNQYLATFIGLGAIGLLWFLIVLLYPPTLLKKWNNYFYFVFIVTLLLSMLTEDTLETQAGATFYAFINSFLLFLYPKDEN